MNILLVVVYLVGNVPHYKTIPYCFQRSGGFVCGYGSACAVRAKIPRSELWEMGNSAFEKLTCKRIRVEKESYQYWAVTASGEIADPPIRHEH